MERILDITLTVNGTRVERRVAPRQHLVDFLREELGLTGSHVGCEHGVCGACTLRVNGEIVRGCLMLAVQANGCRVETVEGLSDSNELSSLQKAFLAETPHPSEPEIREALSGNLCRCTGYQHIVEAVRLAADRA